MSQVNSSHLNLTHVKSPSLTSNSPYSNSHHLGVALFPSLEHILPHLNLPLFNSNEKDFIEPLTTVYHNINDCGAWVEFNECW